jgi:NAD(P)-dependent dehydrogenase (short-subunit alcohol dehydrogenase family)
MRFAGKIVAVTGGTSGFGEAIVHAFATEGAQVHFCGLIDKEGARVMDACSSLTGNAVYHHADVRVESSVEAFFNAILGTESRLDIAINNAGISHSAGRFAELDPTMVADVMQTNLMGVWFGMRHAVLHMLQSGGGAIINVASVLSKSGAEWMAAYGTSKHAVVGLTKSAALDYMDKNIRINAVSPGPMQTPMFERALEDIGGDMSKFAGGLPKGGPADPADVAKTVLHLASDESAYMNGTNVIVDGGVSSG